MRCLKEYQTLKNSKEFNYIYNNSKKQHTASILLFFKKSNQKKVGFTASKKVGNAIKRNFAKRRMRALFLEYSDRLNNGTYVLIAKKDTTVLDYKKLQKDFYYTLKRVGGLKRVS